MLAVGLTGGIASGKTAVSDLFARLGAAIIDTDILARELVEPGQPALMEIVEQFGQNCLSTDGRLDRRYLRKLIFADNRLRKRLEEILHPRIRQRLKQHLANLDTSYCLVVIPLLAESSGLRELLDRTLVVDAPESMQIARVMARDHIDQIQAEQILAAQATRAQRLALADDIIVNDGDIEKLQAEVSALHQRYSRLAVEINCDTRR
jgi:dephospho-CoA kinase